MGMEKRQLGMEGELKAVDYLDREGYAILRRNYRCRWGEIDIIAEKEGVLCFVEVKTRRNLKHGTPAAAVDRRKLDHIRRCAVRYLRQSDRSWDGVRIDVVEVLSIRGRSFVRHLKNVG